MVFTNNKVTIYQLLGNLLGCRPGHHAGADHFTILEQLRRADGALAKMALGRLSRGAVDSSRIYPDPPVRNPDSIAPQPPARPTR